MSLLVSLLSLMHSVTIPTLIRRIYIYVNIYVCVLIKESKSNLDFWTSCKQSHSIQNLHDLCIIFIHNLNVALNWKYEKCVLQLKNDLRNKITKHANTTHHKKRDANNGTASSGNSKLGQSLRSVPENK